MTFQLDEDVVNRTQQMIKENKRNDEERDQLPKPFTDTENSKEPIAEIQPKKQKSENTILYQMNTAFLEIEKNLMNQLYDRDHDLRKELSEEIQKLLEKQQTEILKITLQYRRRRRTRARSTKYVSVLATRRLRN